MRKQKYLIIHCTDTPEGRPVSSDDIEKWHLQGNGWRRVGYADMVHLDGTLENLIDWNQDAIIDPWEVSNGARGYNGIARHIVYVGGAEKGTREPKDTRTCEQKETLAIYIKFNILRNKKLRVIGHNDVSKKACPSFNVAAFCREIGINESNIGL